MTPRDRPGQPYGLDDLVADQRRQTRIVWLVLLAALVLTAGRRLASRDGAPEPGATAPVESAGTG